MRLDPGENVFFKKGGAGARTWFRGSIGFRLLDKIEIGLNKETAATSSQHGLLDG